MKVKLMMIINVLSCFVADGEAATKHNLYKPIVMTKEGNRNKKDLVYEAMRMRTGNWEPQDVDAIKIVGGGILEKKILESVKRNDGPEGRVPSSISALNLGRHYESRGKFSFPI